jgi:hypothetical protein
MAERFKAAVLKTVERKLRGFESLSLRQNKKTFRVYSTESSANGTRFLWNQPLYWELGNRTVVNRRGGRAAEGSCLLSSCGGDSTPGSNPGLSAIIH